MSVNIKKEFGTQRKKPDLSSLVYGKIPPQAAELEEAVLGALMLERDKLNEVLGIIRTEDVFYVDAHRKIYAAIRTLNTNRGAVDLLTVTEQLRKQNELEIVGGAYYLSRLTMAVISSAHVAEHAYIVQEKYMKRELIRIGGEMVAQGYEDSLDVFDQMDTASKNLFELNTGNIRKPYYNGQQLGKMAEDAMQQRMLNPGKIIGKSTGYRLLDQISNGLEDDTLIIIAARPSVGKTALAINLAMNAATSGIGAGFFSLEMPVRQINDRMVSARSHVLLNHIVKGTLAEWEQQEIYKASQWLKASNIHVDDTGGLNVYELTTKARKMVQDQQVGLIVIDYLQLMQGMQEGNREQEISSISRDLKTLAKELHIPIIALSQLSREVEKRGARKPMLSDLRESGSIEQDADQVWFLTRPDYQKTSHETDPALADKADIHIAKSRSGEIDDVPMYFVKEIQCWMDDTDYMDYKGLGKSHGGTWNNAPSQQFDNPRAGMPAGPSKLYIDDDAAAARRRKDEEGDQPF